MAVEQPCSVFALHYVLSAWRALKQARKNSKEPPQLAGSGGSRADAATASGLSSTAVTCAPAEAMACESRPEPA